MKVFFSTLAIILCTLSSLFAQAPAIQWQKTMGGNFGDYFFALQQTADGGYILGGYSNSTISGDKTEDPLGGYADDWVVKLDSTGTIQWQNTIGGNGYEYISAIHQTADGGYILGGSSDSNISSDKTENCFGDLDYWVVKLDATGTIQWQNTLGGSDYDALSTLQLTTDGGFILGGSSKSGISGDKTEINLGEEDYWLLKLDSTGDIQWQNTLGGNKFDVLNSLEQTVDGGYILGGYSASDISDDKTENNLGQDDYWVLKLDSTGTIQWQNTIGGNAIDELKFLKQTADGGYILGGNSTSTISGDKTEGHLGGFSDYWVVKLNASGAIQWQNTIGGDFHDFFNALQQTTDGGYLLGGISDSNISGDKTEDSNGTGDYWVVKLNSIGVIQWQNSIGGSGYDGLSALQQSPDGGYILGGYSDSNISGDKTEDSHGSTDYWVIKLAPETVPTEEAPTAPSLTIYPNPATDILFVRSESATTLCLYNTIGQILSTQTIQGQGKIDLAHYPNGIYFLMEMETGIGHKILKNK